MILFLGPSILDEPIRMIPLPSAHAAAALVVTVIAFVAFANSRLRLEMVCLLLIGVLALGFYLFPLDGSGGLTGMEIAFGGFGHEALVAICCLMILGRGLMVTGALDPAARLLSRLWMFSKILGMLFALLVCMALSMFVNDTPVLVLTLPILLTIAVRANVAASQTLMPVNCAILIGGMATTFGTSTNVLVVSMAKDLGLPPMGVFSFTGIALTAGLVALPYLWLVMPRLLPATVSSESVAARKYRAVLHAGPGGRPPASTPGEARARIGAGARVIGVLRNSGDLVSGDDAYRLNSTDSIVIEGSLDELREASAQLRAPLAAHTILDSIRSTGEKDIEDEEIAELVIGADSALVGRSAKQAEIADRYGTAVIGLARATPLASQAHPVPQQEPLEVGDVLLVRGPRAKLANLERGEGALLLQGGVELPRSSRAPLALAIVAAVVVVAATKLMPIALASLAGVITMLATGCVRFERLGRALSFEVIVLVAASIALGRTIVETGASDWLASIFALALGHVPPAIAIGALMTFAAVLTNFVSNVAAAGISTPLAVSLALQLGAPAEPFVLAVLFGCNVCYVTPMAYQTNLLIMSAGGYQFRDFVRAGLPLAVLMVVTLSILLVRRYGL
jgi:di/tricarboxylate transporter